MISKFSVSPNIFGFGNTFESVILTQLRVIRRNDFFIAKKIMSKWFVTKFRVPHFFLDFKVMNVHCFGAQLSMIFIVNYFSYSLSIKNFRKIARPYVGVVE